MNFSKEQFGELAYWLMKIATFLLMLGGFGLCVWLVLSAL